MTSIIRFLFRPSKTVAACISLSLHVGAIVVAVCAGRFLESPFSLSGRRTAIQLDASIVTKPPAPQIEIQVDIELDPSELEPAKLVEPSHGAEEAVARQVLGSQSRRILIRETELDRTLFARPTDSGLLPPPVAEAAIERAGHEPLLSAVVQAQATTPAGLGKSTHPPPSRALPSPQLAMMVQCSAGLDDLLPPDLAGNRAPEYPPDAIRLGIQGTVMLQLHVAASGQIESVAVSQSSGYPILDNAAVAAVRHWHGRAAQRGGIAVASVEYLPVHFRIH